MRPMQYFKSFLFSFSPDFVINHKCQMKEVEDLRFWDKTA